MHPFDRCVGDACIDQKVGQAQRHAEYQHHAADYLRAIRETAGKHPQVQLAMSESLRQNGIGSGQRGTLGGCCQPADQRTYRDKRCKNFPFCLPQRCTGFGCIEVRNLNAACGFKTATFQIAAENEQKCNHHKSGYQAREEHAVDRHAGNDGVHDQRHGRRKQHAQRAGAGYQADAALFRKAGIAQQRQQQAAEGEYRHTAAAGEGGEKGTEDGGGNHRAGDTTPEQRDKNRAQPLCRTGACKNQSRQGKQR